MKPPGEAANKKSLPEEMDGVVYLDEDGTKLIMLRVTREFTKLADSGVPALKRFAFYDQVHTTGQATLVDLCRLPRPHFRVRISVTVKITVRVKVRERGRGHVSAYSTSTITKEV